MLARFKPTIVLTSICIIVALLLGCVNIITAPEIAKQEERKAKEALYTAYNGGNSYSAPAPSFGGYSAPAAPASDFAMLEDDDAQLPF